MKKIILKLGILMVLAMIILPAMIQVLAANPEPYTLLAPLPCISGGSGTPGTDNYVPDCNTAGETTTLQKYLPGLFSLLIGLSAVAAVLMIVIGGFQYMSTDAIQGKSQGKERIKNAVFGLVLVIGAWLILYTINPALLTLHLEIAPVTTTAPAGTEGTLSPALPIGSVMDRIAATCPMCSTFGGLTYNISPENLARFDCQTCVAFSSQIPYSSNTSINATPGLNSELLALNNGLRQQGVDWQITEAFPPLVNHLDGCHYNGSCVDAKPLNTTPENIKRMFETAQNNGLSPSYEVKTQSEANSLISSLEAIGLQNPLVVVNPNTNGAHFHIEN